MIESKNVIEWFEALARILLRAFVFGYGVVLIWFVVYLIAGDVGIGEKLFGLTSHEVGLIFKLLRDGRCQNSGPGVFRVSVPRNSFGFAATPVTHDEWEGNCSGIRA